MLTIKNLIAGYTKENQILKGINLTVKCGEVVGILGRNGSGKSTLVKSICGLLPYITGEITLDGISISGLRPYEISNMGIGLFLQGGRVFPNLTISENLIFASGKLHKNDLNQRINEVMSWFELFSKTDRLKLKASLLSGGEKHQLALAMVLVQKPKLLILDEPSAGLSPTNRLKLYDSLVEIKKNTEQTILMIEQNELFAKEFCSRILYVQNGILKH